MEEEKEILLIDDSFLSGLKEYESENLKKLIVDFISSYSKNEDICVGEWLCKKLQEELPDKSKEEIELISNEIIKSIETNEHKKNDLENAIKIGRSKENWFASDIKKTLLSMDSKEKVKYLDEIDKAVRVANENFEASITTKNGTINKNPNLDGFIAEQYIAETFNMNAKSVKSNYRAEVLKPKSGTFKKNSVDIVIKDKNSKIVRRYQVKYCKDAEATKKAFERGDYRGQRKLVPEEQLEAFGKKASSVIESPDGRVKSKELSKQKAVKMKEDAQAGKKEVITHNEYSMKNRAVGIGKEVGKSAVQGAAMNAGMELVEKFINDEPIDEAEIVENALTSGADLGVKAAAAGAIKVGIEKDIITSIPKNVSNTAVASIAYTGVESVKILNDVAEGELTPKEGCEKIEQTAVSTAAGIVTSEECATVGATVGATFGPVGAAVGGFVGGVVGYAAGSKVGEKVVKVAQKVRDTAVETVKCIGSGIKSIVCGAFNRLFSIF